jgi:transposase
VVMIGTDSHKRTHTVVALDDVGRRLGELTVAANTDGHLKLLAWARRWEQVSFALEDCRHLTRRLEGDLLGAGARVVRVPTRLMAGARRGGREPGKSDPIDAEAVALAALRHDGLPTAELDGPAREVRLLVDHRRDLVAERTRIQSRLRWYLHELDPTLAVPSRGLRRFCVMDSLAELLASKDGVLVRVSREQLARCRELTVQINQLERELRSLMRRLAPTLLALSGCGVLSAATLFAETAGARRFRSRRLRPLHRNRPDPGLVGQHRRESPAQPRREPHHQLRAAHDRPDPDPRHRPRRRLRREAPRRRQDPHRGSPPAAPPPV